MERLLWIDVAKGLGICLVVFCHLLQGLFRQGLFPFPEAYHQLNDTIYTFHMPLFFYLAGMRVDRSLVARGRAQVLESRLKTLLYPYLVWSIAQVATKVLFAHWVNVPVQWGDLLWIWCYPIEHLWFLYSLFLCYLLYLPLHQKKDLLLAVGVLLQLASPWVSHELTFKTTLFFLYFVLGSLLGDRLLFARHSLGKTLPLALAAFGVSLALPYGLPARTAQALTGITALLQCSRGLALVPLIARPWQVLGRDSLAIYLLHPYGAVVWRLFVTRMEILAALWIPLGLAAAIGSSLLAGKAIHKLRLPLFEGK